MFCLSFQNGKLSSLNSATHRRRRWRELPCRPARACRCHRDFRERFRPCAQDEQRRALVAECLRDRRTSPLALLVAAPRFALAAHTFQSVVASACRADSLSPVAESSLRLPCAVVSRAIRPDRPLERCALRGDGVQGGYALRRTGAT